LSLTRRGRAASGYGAIFFAATAGAVTDPESVVANGQLPIMVRERLVVVDPEWRSRFNRYVQLQDRWTDDTVALFLAPIESP
jgi:hypothetical protein